MTDVGWSMWSEGGRSIAVGRSIVGGWREYGRRVAGASWEGGWSMVNDRKVVGAGSDGGRSMFGALQDYGRRAECSPERLQ